MDFSGSLFVLLLVAEVLLVGDTLGFGESGGFGKGETLVEGAEGGDKGHADDDAPHYEPLRSVYVFLRSRKKAHLHQPC